MKLFYTCLSIYIIAAILTFGYAASDYECSSKQHGLCSMQKAAHGAASALWWPLYWSWELFDND